MGGKKVKLWPGHFDMIWYQKLQPLRAQVAQLLQHTPMIVSHVPDPGSNPARHPLFHRFPVSVQ